MVGSLIFTLFLSWVQVSSDTYIVKSSAGEERAKRVLRELENFHQLIGTTLVFSNTELPELPIEVLLIGDTQTMKELEPEYNGRKVAVAGYYQAGNDRDFIVLSGQVFPQTLTSVVYHELTHYFLTRGLQSRPAWLNEGLAEYFSTAEIHDDEIALGAISQDRLQLLKTYSMLPLKEFFAVDSMSAHYNESSKASVFYAQAWAFMHYMMHGEHAARFRQYLTALQKADANILGYLNVSERELEIGFRHYVETFLQRVSRNFVKVSGEEWRMQIKSIPDTEAQMSIAEIFLANGKVPEARRHLETLGQQTPDSSRVSYYRGVLAQLSGDAAARDFFVDALIDPSLGPRAAVQLVARGDMHIPAVRRILEEASARKTRNPEVYRALGEIYAEDVRRIEEAVRLKQESTKTMVPRQASADATQGEPVVDWLSYGRGDLEHVAYDLLSQSGNGPRPSSVVAPYYPPDLLNEKLAGEVVLEVQVTEVGKVAGLWLVSSTPEIFGTLATAAVRQWAFDPSPGKIRVVLRFNPEH